MLIIKKAMKIVEKISKEYASAISPTEEFNHTVDIERHLNFLPFHLQNPDVRVDVAYSIIANRNYELLPDAIAIRESIVELEEKSIKLLHKKCNFLGIFLRKIVNKRFRVLLR